MGLEAVGGVIGGVTSKTWDRLGSTSESFLAFSTHAMIGVLFWRRFGEGEESIVVGLNVSVVVLAHLEKSIIHPIEHKPNSSTILVRHDG